MPRQAAAATPPPQVAFPLAGNRQTTNKEKVTTVLASDYSRPLSIRASMRKHCLPGKVRAEFITPPLGLNRNRMQDKAFQGQSPLWVRTAAQGKPVAHWLHAVEQKGTVYTDFINDLMP